MKSIIQIIVIGLWIGLIPLNVAAQTKSQIGIHIGLPHYFFDNSPLFNHDREGRPRLKFFNRLNESWGIDYRYELNEQSKLGIKLSGFAVTYHENFKYPFVQRGVGHRSWITVGIIYERMVNLKNSFTFNYGGGLNYRHGRETVITAIIPIGNPENGYLEIISTGGQRRDIGINLYGGIEYKITNWLYTFSKVDLFSFIYIHDKEFGEEMIEDYHFPQFPSRLDLSLKIGLGFSF